jgi:hypothetical protein
VYLQDLRDAPWLPPLPTLPIARIARSDHRRRVVANDLSLLNNDSVVIGGRCTTSPSHTHQKTQRWDMPAIPKNSAECMKQTAKVSPPNKPEM